MTKFLQDRPYRSVTCRPGQTGRAGVPETYDAVIETYKNPFVNLLEVGLVGAVLYHALNGLRVMAVDFWERGPRYQKQMLWVIGVIWVGVMVPGTFFMLKRNVELLFGAG